MTQPVSFPRLMGIVNVTPDSFSDGGKYNQSETAIAHALQLVQDGADILDIGGESSRPGAAEIDVDEEKRRVVPVIEGIRKVHPDIPISIDTVKYDVARAALQAGATMINDISGLDMEPRLAELAAEYKVPLVLMHMAGTPRTMQLNPTYNDVVQDVFDALAGKIERARSLGVQQLYADVGIGFGKTMEHNLHLLANHKKFTELGVPLLLGISRKSFLGKLLGIEKASERDVATLAMHLLLQDSGAEIIRVHNVRYLAQARTLHRALHDRYSTRFK
jgi:dihydropteroate synthase